MSKKFIEVSKVGTTRFVVCVGAFAVKIACNKIGYRCNKQEAWHWRIADTERRKILCPVKISMPLGLLNVMSRAQPLREDEAEELRKCDGFPDWDYGGPDDVPCPFEYKFSDWGYVEERLVALDYAGLSSS